MDNWKIVNYQIYKGKELNQVPNLPSAKGSLIGDITN